MIWKGNPKLEPLLVPVESITTHPRNPRRGDLPMLAQSLDAYGQTAPIVVQPDTNWIVAGNHTYRAALEVNGWTHIAVVKPELEPREYEQYLLMDNRSSDASEYDQGALVEILTKLGDGGSFENTGWDPDMAEDFIEQSQLAAEGAEAEFQGGYGEGGSDPEPKARTASQLMLGYSADDHAEVIRHIQMLRHEYGTAGIGETISRAVEEQFKLVWDGKE